MRGSGCRFRAPLVGIYPLVHFQVERVHFHIYQISSKSRKWVPSFQYQDPLELHSPGGRQPVLAKSVKNGKSWVPRGEKIWGCSKCLGSKEHQILHQWVEFQPQKKSEIYIFFLKCFQEGLIERCTMKSSDNETWPGTIFGPRHL